MPVAKTMTYPKIVPNNTPGVDVLHDLFLRLVRTAPLNNMTTRQVCILWLAYKNDLTIKGLKDTMAVDKPALTRGADVLEEFGLLIRKADPGDRRSVILSITKEGRRVVEAFAGL